jgi:hypothetical protein
MKWAMVASSLGEAAMARGPKALALELTSAERVALENLIRRRKVGQALA